MDVRANLIKLKKNSGERVSEWASAINARKDEAMATLRDEGVEVESWFLCSMNGDDYLLCYMRSKNMERAQQVAKASLHEIDAYHRQFKRDAWVRGSVTELPLLVDLSQEMDGN